MKPVYTLVLALPFLSGCWGGKQKKHTPQPSYETSGVNGLARQVDQLLLSSRQTRAELDLLKPTIVSRSSNPSPAITSGSSTKAPSFEEPTPDLPQVPPPAENTTPSPTLPVIDSPPASSYKQLDLSYGKIPLGKTAEEFGLFGERVKPFFKHGLPDEAKTFIKAGYNYAGMLPGYNDDYMEKIEKENLSTADRTYEVVAFFFLGNSKKRELAIVDKKISIPIKAGDHTTPFAGMVEQISKKVGVRPAISNISDSVFSKRAGIVQYGQFAGWALDDQKIVLLSHAIIIDDMDLSDKDKRDIHIIYASNDALTKYASLEDQGLLEKASEGASAVESAF